MKFKITVSKKDNTEQPWEESYEENIEDPQAWAENTIQRFNSGLRPGEKERVLLHVEIIDSDGIKNHTWGKQNLVTIAKSGQYYDILKCKRCGITAKRYGVDRIIFDSKFKKAKVYLRCDTSLAHFKNMKEQRAFQAREMK